MAKIARSITFKNATISMEDRLITEYLKDETRTKLNQERMSNNRFTA